MQIWGVLVVPIAIGIVVVVDPIAIGIVVVVVSIAIGMVEIVDVAKLTKFLKLRKFYEDAGDF